MKGHSERVPRKNIREFHNRPLLCWILESLSNVDGVAEILINTDSDQIAEIAQEHFQVTIIERPEKLQGDFVSMNKIIAHDLQHAGTDHLLQTHATNPLLQSETIKQAINQYFSAIDEDYDSVFSVTPVQKRFYNAEGDPIFHNPDSLKRTQDLEPIYEENSNIYLFSKSSFNKRNHRIGKNPYLFEMNKLEAYDIDTQEDFMIAELLCQHGQFPDY